MSHFSNFEKKFSQIFYCAPGGQQQEASSARTVEPGRYDDRRSVTSRAAGDNCVSAAMCVARVVPRGWRCQLCRRLPLCRV